VQEEYKNIFSIADMSIVLITVKQNFSNRYKRPKFRKGIDGKLYFMNLYFIS